MDLQQVTDQLATELGRPVLVVGLDDLALATSDADPQGGSNHLVIPVRGGAGTIASFWLAMEGHPPLGSTDYALIDAAAGLTRNLLGDGTERRPGSTRESTMARLLDENLAVRRSAFLEAVAHRWIERGKRTTIRAVLVDDSVGALQRVAFGRQLAAATRSQTTFVREHESVLYLVTRDAAPELDLDAWIRAESLRASVPIVAIGSAHHDPSSDDLGDTAEQARIAADLTAALPELQPSSSISELGGWVMLHAVAAGSRRLADISPAAELLCRVGDQVQRETIETYLDAGGQARAACERLHIHRTTLYYRLDNMPEIVREALDDGMKRSTLHLTLKLIRLWEATGAL